MGGSLGIEAVGAPRHLPMRNRPSWTEDLFIPIAAVLVMLFSLSTIFFDERLHLSAGPPHHVFELYRTATTAP